jgi:ankyrin repeat protein
MCRDYKGSLDVIILPQASPEQTKKQQQHAGSAMRKNHEKNRQDEEEARERGGSEAVRELPDPHERRSGRGQAMTGQQLWAAARDGDAAKVNTLLSTQAAQSLINLQDTNGATPLFMAAEKGHEAVTKELIAARCNMHLQEKHDHTALHIAARSGHEAVGYKGHAPVTKQLLGARCDEDLETRIGRTALQLAQIQAHAGIATLIRNTKHIAAEKAMNENPVQTGPARLPEHLRGGGTPKARARQKAAGRC